MPWHENGELKGETVQDFGARVRVLDFVPSAIGNHGRVFSKGVT